MAVGFSPSTSLRSTSVSIAIFSAAREAGARTSRPISPFGLKAATISARASPVLLCRLIAVSSRSSKSRHALYMRSASSGAKSPRIFSPQPSSRCSSLARRPRRRRARAGIRGVDLLRPAAARASRHPDHDRPIRASRSGCPPRGRRQGRRMVAGGGLRVAVVPRPVPRGALRPARTPFPGVAATSGMCGDRSAPDRMQSFVTVRPAPACRPRRPSIDASTRLSLSRESRSASLSGAARSTEPDVLGDRWA